MDTAGLPETVFANLQKYQLTNATTNSSLNATFVRGMVEDHLLDSKQKEHKITIGLVILYIPTFLAGIFGNSFLAYIIISKRSLQNATNILLCSLAFADLSGKIFLKLQCLYYHEGVCVVLQLATCSHWKLILI